MLVLADVLLVPHSSPVLQDLKESALPFEIHRLCTSRSATQGERELLRATALTCCAVWLHGKYLSGLEFLFPLWICCVYGTRKLQ